MQTQNARIDDAIFFTLRETQLLDRWGDYGSVLCNGISLSGKICQPLHLGRTGPFVPPISFPLSSNSVVVTDEVKKQLEASSLGGVGEFHRVVLDKVVFIPWVDWDWQNDLKDSYLPFNGEPDEYILHGPHSPSATQKMDVLWTWHPEQIGKVLRSKNLIRLEGLSSTADVFRLADEWWTRIFVNKRGMSIVENIARDWVTFEAVAAEIPG